MGSVRTWVRAGTSSSGACGIEGDEAVEGIGEQGGIDGENDVKVATVW
jgi:hypothetical protein